MLRAWRNECLCIGAAVLVLLVVGVASGHTQTLMAIGLAAYVGWHVLNFGRLHRWLAYGRQFQVPLSVGVWEEIFDGLQRRQLRNRRRKSNLAGHLREFRKAGGQLPDGLVLLGEDGTVLRFNQAAGKLLALAWPEDRGRRVIDLIAHPALSDAVTGAHASRSLEVAAPANAAWMLSLQTTAMFGEHRQRLLVVRDITPFYSVEKVRRDFVADVSHELRTPITVFRGYLGSLCHDSELVPWQAPLASMDEQAQRMQELVDELLLLSRLEMTHKAQPADLVAVATMLEGIIEQAQMLSGAGDHRLVLHADDTTGLWGDQDELHSAFANLVFNAVRHTPPETRIVVTWRASADGAGLTVQDFGPGIAAHHLPRLTERFYRVDAGRARQKGGTGLGLAIVKQVLERHDAELKIASEPGQGTTFGCHFPRDIVDIRATAAPARTFG